MLGPFRYGAVASIAGPGHLAGGDAPAQVDVHDPVHVPRRAHRRHAAGEVEARKAHAELPVDAGTGRVIQVLVQHDEAGDDALAGEIDDRRAGRRHDGRRGAELGDVAVANHERLIRPRGRAGAVNDADMRQRNDSRVDFHELTDGIRDLEALRERQRGDGRDQSNDDEWGTAQK